MGEAAVVPGPCLGLSGAGPPTRHPGTALAPRWRSANGSHDGVRVKASGEPAFLRDQES